MSRLGTLGIAILAVHLWVSCPVSASPDAATILRDSYASEGKLRFAGRMTTTVCCSSGKMASADVKILRSGRMSRMDYVSGPSAGTSIIDDGTRVMKLVPASRTAYLSESPDAPERLDLLLANHVPTLVGTSKVAGRDCYAIKLAPKCACSPSEKLWVDKSSHLALKIERYSSDGKLLSSTVYRSVDFSARPAASEFRVPSGWKTVSLRAPSVTGLDAVMKVVGFTPVKPRYVPKGYRFDDYYLRETPKCTPYAALRYTNGLNTISIFERKGGCFGRGYGCGRGRGRGRGFGGGGCGSPGCCLIVNEPQAKMAHAVVGDLTVIVVGDISPAELQKTAASFK